MGSEWGMARGRFGGWGIVELGNWGRRREENVFEREEKTKFIHGRHTIVWQASCTVSGALP